jgi:hypothetical protein
MNSPNTPLSRLRRLEQRMEDWDRRCAKGESGRAIIEEADDIMTRLYSLAFEWEVQSEKKSHWVPTTERHPDKDGRLWAILVERREDGKHTGYIPLYEYYHFIDGWATDDHVTHWLDADLHPLPGIPK